MKERAKTESGVTAACFDLEKVLNCLHGEVSSFYYHRKLSVYNLTVYDLGTGDGSCYVWPEVVAQRGANEIASCLMDYIQLRAAQGTKIFELFSDNCSGQNRNRFVAALYWFIVGSNNSVESITHSFLEVGHTQNENDAIHSVIERAVRKLQIYTPEQWSAVCSNSTTLTLITQGRCKLYNTLKKKSTLHPLVITVLSWYVSSLKGKRLNLPTGARITCLLQVLAVD